MVFATQGANRLFVADVLLVTRTVAVCACHRLGSIWVHWGDAKRVSNEPWQSIALERYHRSTSFPSQKSGRDDVVGVTSEPVTERSVVLTLVEASDYPLQLQAKERALRQISRLAGTESSYALLNSVTARPSSHFGKVAQTFLDIIGCPENVPPIPPPHREDNHLKIATDIVDLPRRKKIAETVARYIGNETISTYADMIHVYTDGSVKGDSATAAYVVPEMGLSCKDQLSNCTSSTTAELTAM